jgi:protein involved in polysaccharide export with SLBB domain
VYRLPPGTTIAEAVAQAGGPTQAAKLGSVRLVRAGQELRVDLRRPHTELAATSIRSGDQIVIDRRGSFVRDVLTPIASLTAAIVAVVNIAIK